MQGYIALHRKTIKSTVFQDDGLFKLWCYCLMKATHKEREFLHGGILVSLKCGQFITGRKVLTDELNSTEQKVRSRLALLEKMGNLTIKSTNKYSIITVVKWEDYQTQRNEITNKQPTNNQQITTNNNVNNDNNTTEPSSEDLKANQKDMGNWNKTSDDFEEDLQVDPDHTPKGKPKKAKKVSDDVQAVFDLFNNPASALWRMREFERVAAQALFDHYGLETISKRIQRIAIEKKKNADDPFFPLITTPSQLLDKMEAVERYLNI